MNPVRNFNKANEKRDISNGVKKIFLIFLLFFIGCSPLELSRLFGAGTRCFREQGKIYSKVFDTDFFSCYAQVTQKLEEMQVFPYRGGRKEGFLVVAGFNKIFPQCSKSTEVAIFFTELENFKTQVEVASLNYSLAEFAASKIFNRSEDKKVEGIRLEGEVSRE